MRKVFRFIVALLVMVLLLTFVVRVAARQQSAPETVKILLPDDSCPPPCWIGVNTDETEHAQTVEAIMSLPRAMQEGIIEWTFGTDAVQTVRLERGRDVVLRTEGIRLGEILSALDLPDYQLRGNLFNQRRSFAGEYVRFYFAEEHLTVAVDTTENGRISPESPVIQMAYPAGPFPEPPNSHVWQGFIQMPAYTEMGFGESIVLE